MSDLLLDQKLEADQNGDRAASSENSQSQKRRRCRFAQQSQVGSPKRQISEHSPECSDAEQKISKNGHHTGKRTPFSSPLPIFTIPINSRDNGQIKTGKEQAVKQK